MWKKIALTACIKQNYLNYKLLTEASNQDKQNIHKQQIVHKILCII